MSVMKGAKDRSLYNLKQKAIKKIQIVKHEQLSGKVRDRLKYHLSQMYLQHRKVNDKVMIKSPSMSVLFLFKG